MSTLNSVVAVYDSHAKAEAAIKDLQEAGVDMKSLSIAAKDTHTDEHVVGYYNAGDRMKYWGKLGAFWGGFWGLLFGSAMFAIPGIGPDPCGWPTGRLDRGSSGRCRRCRRCQRDRCRPVQHRGSKGQRHQV